MVSSIFTAADRKQLLAFSQERIGNAAEGAHKRLWSNRQTMAVFAVTLCDAVTRGVPPPNYPDPGPTFEQLRSKPLSDRVKWHAQASARKNGRCPPLSYEQAADAAVTGWNRVKYETTVLPCQGLIGALRDAARFATGVADPWLRVEKMARRLLTILDAILDSGVGTVPASKWTLDGATRTVLRDGIPVWAGMSPGPFKHLLRARQARVQRDGPRGGRVTLTKTQIRLLRADLDRKLLPGRVPAADGFVEIVSLRVRIIPTDVEVV